MIKKKIHRTLVLGVIIILLGIIYLSKPYFVEPRSNVNEQKLENLSVMKNQENQGLEGLCQSEQECREFCEKKPSDPFCIEEIKKRGIPGKCYTKEECDTYCSENPSDPGCMVMMPGGYEKLSMPFDKEDFSPNEFGIWPFCVHGGEHPEGHGGLDFELRPETEVVASADGVVEYVESPEGALHGWGHGIYVNHGTVMAGYVCLLNTNLKEGDRVKRGEFLGNPCRTDQGEYFIHYEVMDYTIERRVCPLNYIDKNFSSALSEMFKKATYPEKSQEPNICNCESLPLPK